MKLLIRKLLQRFGYDIVKYNPPYTPGLFDKQQLLKDYQWLVEYDFHSILDIGANEGQFSDKMRLLFPQATIHAFEPIKESYDLLQKNFSGDSFFIPYNLALGDQSGELIFNQNEYSPSSSLLPLAGKHIDSFDYAVKTKPVSVRVERLTDFFQRKNIDKPLLIKIDVQGFEDKVIEGGHAVLQKATMILCEVSFIELYKGQSLFADISNELASLGFVYAGCTEQLRSPENNQVLQADAIFLKKEK